MTVANTDGNPRAGILHALVYVSEPGLYSLILRSRKPEARAFKRWVTHEVIPSIRKHGGYLAPARTEEILDDPDSLIRLAMRLKEDRARMAALEARARKIEEKAAFCDAVMASSLEIEFGEMAVILRQNGVEIGKNRLLKEALDDGLLIKNNVCGRYYLPTQKAVELGLLRERTEKRPSGHMDTKPMVTPRGQMHFFNKYIAQNRLF